jgi:hypothetical protein
MSLNGTRAAIKAALDTVTGVTGYLKRPSTPKPGDAWPLWRGAARGDVRLFEHAWAVAVLLPQDELAANDWVDDHIDALVDALRPVLYVEGYDPANFGPEGSPAYGLLITGTIE